MRDEGGENKKSQCVFIFLNVFKIEGKNNNDDETLRGGGEKGKREIMITIGLSNHFDKTHVS